MLPKISALMTGMASPNRVDGADGETDQHGRTARGGAGGGGALWGGGTAREGAHPGRTYGDDGLASQASVRALSAVSAFRTFRLQPCEEMPPAAKARAQLPTGRRRKYADARDTLIALWEASDRVCGKRLVAMIPALMPALERHGCDLIAPRCALFVELSVWRRFFEEGGWRVFTPPVQRDRRRSGLQSYWNRPRAIRPCRERPTPRSAKVNVASSGTGAHPSGFGTDCRPTDS